MAALGGVSIWHGIQVPMTKIFSGTVALLIELLRPAQKVMEASRTDK
jgi:hypothetical protein